jgi:hypothetical protein
MLIPAQNSNKTNCKIQDCFANRQIKEDVKCNKHIVEKLCLISSTNYVKCIYIYIEREIDYCKNICIAADMETCALFALPMTVLAVWM